MTFSTLASPGVSLQGGGGSGGGGGGTPGGSNTQIQYNSSGTFAGASGLTTTGTELTIASGTKTADAPVLNMSQTWNNAAVTFTGLKFNATDTASNAASLLLDLQTGGTSRFNLTKAGTLTFAGNLQIANNAVYIEGTAVGTVRVPGIGGYYGFTTNTASTSASTIDTFVTRRAAANLRFGAADAAAPVAQTLSVQSVVAGTTNTAGANLTITGSQGTGTGAGGSIVFQVAPAGGTGTAQNALATALTIDSSSGCLILRNGISIINESNNTLSVNINSGTIAGSNTAFQYRGSTEIFQLRSGVVFGWTSGDGNGVIDTILRRDAANTLALRNGANPQAFRLYNTTDGTNSEFFGIIWSSNRAILTTATAGTGVTNRDLYLQNDQASQNVFCAAPFKFSLDNTYDIGAFGANRPRNIYAANALVSTSAQVGAGGVASSGYGVSGNAATGLIWPASNRTTLFNNANAGEGIITLNAYNSGYAYDAAGDILSARYSSSLNTIALASATQLSWTNGQSRTGTPDLGMKRSAAGIVAVTNGSTGGGAVELQEMTAPAAPATNNVRIYAEDNGSGKTRIMALFPTGAAVQIAIEP